MREPVAEAYGNMISYFPWQWFLTLTFAPKHEGPSGGMHPEKAMKAFRVLVQKVGQAAWGREWWTNPHHGIYWVVGEELHKSGRIHFHAVMSASVDLNEHVMRVELKEWWYRAFGIARIEKPASQGDVSGYVSKYVSKGGEVHLSPNLSEYAHAVRFARQSRDGGKD